ncbi:MAG: hypothetical protein IPI41_10530 [Flavobacteriales bacterium]|nr:hypothetical protein [Flavobacteriales bacterium]
MGAIELSTGADKMWTAFEPIGTNGGCREMDCKYASAVRPSLAYEVTVVSDRQGETDGHLVISVSVKGQDDETSTGVEVDVDPQTAPM